MISPFAPARRSLATVLALAALAVGSFAGATSTIDPSTFSTVSATVWQFLLNNSSRHPSATCYRSTSRPEESFTCLMVALRGTKLDAVASGSDPVTLFAPTDAAFARLASQMGQGAFTALMRRPADLKALLQSMMVSGRFTSADLQARSSGGSGRLTLPTLAGGELQLTFSRFKAPNGQVAVAVGSTLQPGWKTYLTGRTTLLTNGSVVPMDMVPLPPSLR